MLLKNNSHNSDRYKEPVEDNDGEDEEEDLDEYDNEIVDLGDDVQPFSMQFKPD